MTTLTLRTTKGSPLTNAELDANFTSLNLAKIELGGDLQGTTSSPVVSGLQGRSVSASTPTVGNVIAWNGVSQWSYTSVLSTLTVSSFSATTVSASTITTTSTILDNKGDVRAAPIQTKASAYVVAATDAGQTIFIATGGVTINASVLSAGDMITIVNNSASNQTLTAGASVTFRLAGSATTGNRTLAQRGMATFLCVVGGATPEFICSGAGLS
jgi:hypothetical protein